MPKGVYIRKRKSARKKRVVKQKQKQKQSQKVNVNVSAGGSGGGGVQYIPVPQYTPPQQTYMMPSQASIMEQAPSLLSGFSNILRNELTNFGRSQNQMNSINEPTMANVREELPKITESAYVPPAIPASKPMDIKPPTEGSGLTRTYAKMREEQKVKEITEKNEMPVSAKALQPSQFALNLDDLLKAKETLRPTGFVLADEKQAQPIIPESMQPRKRRTRKLPADAIILDDSSTTDSPQKRKAGRPAGSKNKPKLVAQALDVPSVIAQPIFDTDVETKKMFDLV